MKRILKKIKGNHNGPENKSTGNSKNMNNMMSVLASKPMDNTKIPMRPNPNNAKVGKHHTSGLPGKITSEESGISYDTTTGGIDEGSFGPIVRPQVPMRNLRPYVVAQEESANYTTGEKFYLNKK